MDIVLDVTENANRVTQSITKVDCETIWNQSNSAYKSKKRKAEKRVMLYQQSHLPALLYHRRIIIRCDASARVDAIIQSDTASVRSSRIAFAGEEAYYCSLKTTIHRRRLKLVVSWTVFSFGNVGFRNMTTGTGPY
jgi:hypothetical protein